MTLNDSQSVDIAGAAWTESNQDSTNMNSNPTQKAFSSVHLLKVAIGQGIE